MTENFVDMTGLTYCGKEAQEIFTKQLYESDVHNYGVRYMPNVKGKQKLMYGEVSDLYQAYNCDFAPYGEAKLTESFIEPVAIKVNLEECYDEFWPTYLVEQTEITLNGGIPSDFYNWFFNNVLQKELQKEYEEMFWNGDTGYTGTTKYKKLTDGIVKKIADATGSTKVTGVALTTSNILAKVGEVAAAILDIDGNIDDYKIYMNYVDYRKLVTALGENSNSPLTTQVWSNFSKIGDKIYAYGFEVVPTRIDKNVILATHPKNLVLGYDVDGAELTYKIIDMRETTMENKFRVGVIANIAVGVIYPELAVIAKP